MQRSNAIHEKLQEILEQLETLLAWDSALGLAYHERTGLELQPSGKYTAADAARAKEIMLLCWRDRADMLA